MRETHIIPQTWPFTCLSCDHAWEARYEAWHVDDGRGGNVITWRYKGAVAMPPWIEPACPSCASLRVKTIPPGTPQRNGTSRANGTTGANGTARTNGTAVNGTEHGRSAPDSGSAAGGTGGDAYG